MHTHEMSRAEASRVETGLIMTRSFLLVTILAAVAWRLYGLNVQPLWWDEGWSIYFAVADVPEMLRLTAVDIHPPLYYLLLHGWIWLCGPSVLAVRFLSLVIGVAAVPLIYVVGRRLGGRRLGAVAALLLAFSPMHIYYSQEVRMYGLVTLAGLATFYFALSWRKSDDGSAGQRLGAGTWIGYVASATAALYTQYYATFLLLALNLLVMGGWWRRGATRGAVLSWLGAQAAVVALYAPWLWYAGPKLVTYVGYKVGVEQDPSLDPFTYLARHLAAFQWGHAEGVLADWWWVGLLPLLLVLALVWISRAGREASPRATSVAWPLAIVVVALACGFVVNILLPFNPPRFERLLLLALPACLLVFAALLTWLVPDGEPARSRMRRVVLVAAAAVWLTAAVVSLVFFYTVPRYPDDDYRPVAAQLAALSTPEDAIITVHPWQAGYFYSYLPDDEARPTVVLTPREVLPREKQVWAADPSRLAADLGALLRAHGRVWLADHQALGRVLEARIETYLQSEAYPVLREWHGENTVLSLFAAGAPVRADANARLGDWLVLDGVAIDPGPLPAAAGVVPVDLYWRVLARPAGDYRIGLRLVGQTGQVWAQRDTAPLAGLWPFAAMPVGEPVLDRHGLLVPAGTPPGEYRLTVRVYDAGDLSVLPATFAGGSGGEVTLGTVRVTRPEAAPPVEALTYGDVMTMTQTLDVGFGPLRLLGSTLPSSSVLVPGEPMEVVLFWQALTDPGEDFYPWLRLGLSGGPALTMLQEKPVAGTYPTAWWQAGELVRDPHKVYVPATAGPGEYQLTVGLVRAADEQPVDIRGDDVAVPVGKVMVGQRQYGFTPLEPSRPQPAPMGEQVAFLGYDISGSPATPGDALQVVLYWHVLQTLDDSSYHAFVHLLNSYGQIVAQADGVPGEGRAPTRGWLSGAYVIDPHTIALPVDLPPGTYRLVAGLYDPVSGYRPAAPIPLGTPVTVDP